MNLRVRWLYLAVGTLMLMLAGLLYAWSIFRGPLSILFPSWTATQMSTIFMISMIACSGFGFCSGILSQKIKCATIIRIACLLFIVGFGAVTLLLDENAPDKSLIIICIFYGILCGGGIGFIYNSIMGAVTRWFPNDTGMASGVLLMGFGVGGIVLGSIVNKLAENIGIQNTFFIIGAGLAIFLFAGSFFMKTPPWLLDNYDAESSESEGSAQTKIDANALANETDLDDEKNYTVKEMLRTLSAWVLFFSVMALGIGGMIVINSAAVIAVSFGASAIVGLIVSVFNGIGRFALGKSYDVFGRVKSYTGNCIIMVLAGIILLIGSWTGNMIFMLIGLPMMGLAFGGTPSLLSAMTTEFYGPKHFPANYGFMVLNIAVSAVIGPILSGRLQDASNGSFEGSFIMLIIVGVVALLLGFSISHFAKKEGLIKS